MTERTWSIVRKIFPEGLQNEAARLLELECGTNLPLLQDADDVQLERLRFAILKLSGGTLEGLSEAIRIAKSDWRDTLMGTGFGQSVTAHERWADKVLNQPDNR